MIFLVFWGEPSAFVREQDLVRRHQLREGPAVMFWPVAVLAVLSVIGGWIQFAPFWTPISDFLAPAAEPLVEATGTQELVSSVFGVLFGLGGHGRGMGLLRRQTRAGTTRAAGSESARAEALVRRPVRRALLPPGRLAREGPAALGRAAR